MALEDQFAPAKGYRSVAVCPSQKPNPELELPNMRMATMMIVASFTRVFIKVWFSWSILCAQVGIIHEINALSQFCGVFVAQAV